MDYFSILVLKIMVDLLGFILITKKKKKKKEEEEEYSRIYTLKLLKIHIILCKMI
jgi:hypothetical protein